MSNKLESLESLKSKLELHGHKSRISKDRYNTVVLKWSRKGVGRVEVTVGHIWDRTSHRQYDGYHINVYRKNEYGGYAINNEVIPNHDGGTISTSDESRVIKIIDFVNTLPEVQKTKEREKTKQQNECILQNIIARLLQQKSSAHIYNLAKSGNDSCLLRMDYLSVSINPNSAWVEYGTSCGHRRATIPAEYASPDFDPEELVNKIIAADDKVCKANIKMISDVNKILGVTNEDD